jgi:hypothetical protein
MHVMHTHDARDVRSTLLARTGMLFSCFLQDWPADTTTPVKVDMEAAAE